MCEDEARGTQMQMTLQHHSGKMALKHPMNLNIEHTEGSFSGGTTVEKQFLSHQILIQE